MYEAVHAYPDGESTVARYARTASRYGFDGIVVRNRDASAAVDAVRDQYEIDVVQGVEIVADDPGQAGGAVGNFRPDFPLVTVRGGDNAINRFAVEQDRVDVLTQPMRGGGDFNHVLAKAARDNGTRIEFDLGPVLRDTGGHRVQAIQDLTKLAELCEHYGTRHVVSATASGHLQLRAPRELVAVGDQLGFTAEFIRDGLREWGQIASQNRERQSADFIEPGVKKGPYDDSERN